MLMLYDAADLIGKLVLLALATAQRVHIVRWMIRYG